MSGDRVPLALCVAEVAGSCGPETWKEGRRKKRVVVIYLQGFVLFVFSFFLFLLVLFVR